MRASSKRILSILLAGLFLIGLIVVATSLTKPAFDGVVEKKAELFSKQELYNNQKGAIDEVQGLLNKFQEASRVREVINMAVPLEEDITNALNQIDAIARTAGVKVISFKSSTVSFSGPDDDPFIRRLGSIETEMNVAGDYENLRNFMKFLETNVRVFDVSDLSISSNYRKKISSTPGEGGNSSGEESELAAKITAEIFFQE